MRLEVFRHHALALMLVDTRFLLAVSLMAHPRYFETPEEQHIVRTILEHYREHGVPPKRMALLDRLHSYFSMTKSKNTTLEDVVDLVESIWEIRKDAAEQSTYIHERMVEFCREQALTEALIQSVEDIQQKKIGSEIRTRIEKALTVGASLKGSGVMWLKDAADPKNGVSSMDEIRETVPTGLPFIDKPTHGGLARGELGFVMAPPHTGKTTVLSNIGVGALKHRANVCHISLEMKEPLIRAMYDRCFAGKPDSYLSKLSSEEHAAMAQWLVRVQQKLQADVNIKFFNMHRLSVEGLRAYLMMLESVHGFKPDLVILDYLDLMQMPTHIKDEVKQLTWVGEELRTMADEMNFACWTATQTNRGGASKDTVKSDDVAGDFQKIAYADMILSLNQTQKEAEEGIMRIFWLKTRAGKKYQTFTTFTDFDRARIEPA